MNITTGVLETRVRAVLNKWDWKCREWGMGVKSKSRKMVVKDTRKVYRKLSLMRNMRMFIETWTEAQPVFCQLFAWHVNSPQAGTSSGYSRIESSPTSLTSTLKLRCMMRRAMKELTSSEPQTAREA